MESVLWESFMVAWRAACTIAAWEGLKYYWRKAALAAAEEGGG